MARLALVGASPDIESPRALPYGGGMSDELSKRIDDVHKRFDDLRADMPQRFGEINQRVGELRADMDQRFGDMNQKLSTFMWIVSAWFTFLTAVLAVFGFLRR